MSANEKTQRAAQKAERKAAAAAEQEKKDRRYRRSVVIVAVILVVLIIGALLVNSDYFYTKTTAMTVGNTKYSPAEVSYFYRSTYNTVYQNLYSQLGSMTSMVLDNSKPLNEQPYPYGDDENMTWADAIAETANEDIVRVTSFYEAAVKAGRTLSSEDEATINDALQNYRDYAASSGFANVNKFYGAYYGKGVTEELVAGLQEKIVLGSTYYDEVRDSFVYSADELAAYYAEHADELDYYHYIAYPVSNSLDVFADLQDAELTEKVHAAAQEIVDSATDVSSFIQAVKDFAGASTIASVTTNPANNIGDAYKDWITDPARQPGDTTVIDQDNLAYAVYFVGFDQNDYNTVDFRHILITVGTDEDGTYTDEALTIARGRAQTLLYEWEEDPTEEHFIELVDAYSDDANTNKSGGLFEQVVKYQMVNGINDFLFEEGHAAGDVGIVFGQNSTYAGYHLVYYVGENLRNCDILAESAKRTEDFAAKSEEIIGGNEAITGSGMRFVQAF